MTSRDPQRCCEAVRSAILAFVEEKPIFGTGATVAVFRDNKCDSIDLSSTVDKQHRLLIVG